MTADSTSRPDLVRGAEPTSRRTRLLLVGAVVLALLAVGADRWWADRERDRLSAAVLAGEQVIDGSRTSLSSLAAYSAGLLTAADVPGDVRQSAFGNLQADARRWSPRVRAAQGQVAATGVLPWHRDARSARAAYDGRLQAWAEALDRFADDGQNQIGDDSTVTAARLAARDALREAGLDLLR